MKEEKIVKESRKEGNIGRRVRNGGKKLSCL